MPQTSKTLTAVREAANFSPNLTLDIARRVTGTYQRLYRRARNRGDHALSGVYQAFAEDLHRFLQAMDRMVQITDFHQVKFHVKPNFSDDWPMKTIDHWFAFGLEGTR